MKFGAKKNPTVLAGVTFRAKFHSKFLYSVENKIVGISQYAYFSAQLYEFAEKKVKTRRV
jgi:hypothetical protein